ncbi:HNH endonuclease [Luteimonas sp. MHLX1A]|uniref:HNH endonuclease n=1 Tax=Alterluteimonas muca TaxID=2878684 RepID=UPI001E53097A|nr:HNH endonuclease [Luteimonas sp. MHLX1A]MCD9045535.1 HNH endonuclease [Luteimonas sp. MHLX1A]
MTNAVFIASESSAYDDLIEERYHFPRTYLRQVEAAVGDWIVYYEPRRTSGPSSATGRQAYFAIAQVAGVIKDNRLADHYYALMRGFIAFDSVVPFRDATGYRESKLLREDGKTNKGAFGRAVRELPRDEFDEIVRRGFQLQAEPWEQVAAVAEEVPDYVSRPIVEVVTARKVRDVAFRRQVRAAYANTCAVTGLRLINGGGRPEVQAAHIRSVEADGPDAVRNGIALTGTAHWLFDRGLMTFGDDYQIILSPHGVPQDLDKLIRPERKLVVPDMPELRPHPKYLQWHRDNCFKA